MHINHMSVEGWLGFAALVGVCFIILIIDIIICDIIFKGDEDDDDIYE